MKLEELKSDFHNLIDQINDPELLSQLYDVLNQSKQLENSLWQSLSPEMRKEVLEAYNESEDDANLISLQDIKLKNKEWPLK